jgi:hypothetical protein
MLSKRLPLTLVARRSPENDATAALDICGSLLLPLTDLRIISEQDTRDVLTDVVTSHQKAGVTSATPEKHHAVVAFVQRILLAGVAVGVLLGGWLREA